MDTLLFLSSVTSGLSAPPGERYAITRIRVAEVFMAAVSGFERPVLEATEGTAARSVLVVAVSKQWPVSLIL